MKRARLGLPSVAVLVLLAGGPSVVGQVASSPATRAQGAATGPRPEQVLLSAIRSHPLTAPYPIMATWQKGKVVLSGRVGAKQVHDAAVRMAIDIGVPFRDDLLIDTGTAHVVAQSAAAVMGGGAAGAPGVQSASPYVYPPPLFGRLDDPFFGFVPPLVSFPPWWPRGTQSGPMMARPGSAAQATASGAAPGGTPQGGWRPLELDPVKGQVEISVDMSGQVWLRGAVVSEQDAREIEEAARSVRGVTTVYNQLEIVPRRAGADHQVPPPPVPMQVAPRREGGAAAPPSSPPAPSVVPARPKPAPAATAPAALDSQTLTTRVVGSLERRPQAAGLPVKVRSTDGAVTLSGQVPSAYEAMLVYRAAQQTPGVHEIIDRLEFTVPDEDHPNPLLQKGRPEDIEPYLASQIRRHVGDLAHIDRIQARGDLLELRGTISNAADQDRLLAILRSIPVLHGFQLDTKFNAE